MRDSRHPEVPRCPRPGVCRRPGEGGDQEFWSGFRNNGLAIPQVCRTVNEKVCETVTEQACHVAHDTVYEDQCHQVPEKQCHPVPSQVITIIIEATVYPLVNLYVDNDKKFY